MASKKWFGIAAAVAAIGAAAGLAVNKLRESPESAAEMYEGVKETAKAGPEKAAAIYGAAKEKVASETSSDEKVDAELEPAAN